MADEIQAPTETELVQILSAPAPYEIHRQRNEDTARRSYPNSTGMESVVTDRAFDGADAPAEVRERAVKELRNIFVDTGLAAAEVSELMNRASIVRHEGKSAEVMRKEARTQLARMFPTDDPTRPNKGADDALADARRLVGRDPRLARFIERQGLGNDAEAIALMARTARSQRNQGKLK